MPTASACCTPRAGETPFPLRPLPPVHRIANLKRADLSALSGPVLLHRRRARRHQHLGLGLVQLLEVAEDEVLDIRVQEVGTELVLLHFSKRLSRSPGV